MFPTVATIFFAIGIVGLFVLDRSKNARQSKALWIPIVWMFFCSSRSLAQWLGMDATSNEADVYLEGSPVDRNFLILVQVIALIVLIYRGRRVATILSRNWAIGLFFSYAALSIAWSDYPFVTFKHLIKGSGDIMMILIVLTEPDIPVAIERLITRLGFVLVPLSLLLIWYYPSIGRTRTMDWTPEAVGVCTQKNGLGELCDIFGLGILWRLRSVYTDRYGPNRVRRLMAYGAVLAMIVWLLHLCNSMTSICALSMTSTVMLISTWPAVRRRPAFVHLLVGGVLSCTIFALFFQSSGSLIRSLGRDPTLSGRTVAWPQFLSLVNNQFLGVGYESFWLGDRIQKVWVITQGLHINEAHSGYVEVLLTLGWIGEILLGVLLATGYRNVIRAYRRDPVAGSLRIAWFLAPLITNLTEAAFRMMSPPWIVFLLATAVSPWGASVSACGRGRAATLPRKAVQELPELREAAGMTGISG